MESYEKLPAATASRNARSNFFGSKDLNESHPPPSLCGKEDRQNELKMDDTEHVCPLCCEDLDLSDQQFYPCKCGYQVCMWCWHRIREQETGLCPACRTPYGDDPHEFSAVDVEDVLKANKEKEAAQKRERQRAQHEGEGDLLDEGSGPMEPPKDRTQLANMRVIRRNLVYAVGLPPTIASEDTLRKPDYFGQYGKISKVVLNRSNTTGGDPRRASASAYVTFVHKEDTLSCILALDGFFIDGRNVRASYGTSKYCSAFIKNVRCNNPECTYLHCMGEAEDTFTKQEIQAGYVTSGRDVLARQQQIVAQALSAAAAGSGTRRKVGGGGPSGTGKASSSPIFPPPTYDEPQKQSVTLVPPPPTATAHRAVSQGTGFSMATSTTTTTAAARPTLVARSVSLSEPPSASLKQGAIGATAASVVAGVHSVSSAPAVEPAPHTTLTSLTPLNKRPSQTKPKGASALAVGASSSTDSGSDSLLLSRHPQNLNSKLTALRSSQNGTASTSPASSISSINNNTDSSLIGGAVIGGAPIPSGGTTIGGTSFGNRSALGSIGGNLGRPAGSSSAALGGPPISGLGGEVYTGQSTTGGGAIGAQKDRWGAAGTGSGTSAGVIGGGSSFDIGGGALWSNGGSNKAAAAAPIGSGLGAAPGVIGGGFGSSRGPLGGGDLPLSNSGSSALASMLGISLPTGSGSLRDSSPLWTSSSSQPQTSSLNGAPAGVIGSGPKTSSGNSNRVPIGGLAVGPSSNPAGFGGASIGPPKAAAATDGGKNNDIAMLQSLLPGVHITSGNAQQPAAPSTLKMSGNNGGNGWNPMSGYPHEVGLGSWGAGAAPGGIIGQDGSNKQEQGQSSIW